MSLPLIAELGLAVVVLFGHFVMWVGVNNRLHAMPIPRTHLKAMSALSHFGSLAVPVVFIWWLWNEQHGISGWLHTITDSPTALFYVLMCIGMALVHFPRWLFVRFVAIRKAHAAGERLHMVDMVERLGLHPTRGWKFAVGRHWPGNQVMQVEFNEKEFPVANLPDKLDGLRILHLSDLHFSGRVDPEFFEQVVAEANKLTPDVVCLTGDVCDVKDCVPWIEPLLKPLEARYGKFYILGNHDQRLSDVAPLHAAMARSGFTAIGSRAEHHPIAGVDVLVAGNEMPWFGPAPVIEPTDAFKLLLSHSPDYVRWAKRNHFDLMLSGHTHGGQVCFPAVGPVVCPSWYGLRYVSGLFSEPTLVTHVSRGVSGLFPIRWNCRPEVSVLILRKMPVS